MAPPKLPARCELIPAVPQAFLIGKDGRLYDVQAWFHATTMAGAIEELLLLESGLANSTDLERFRQQRTEMHQAVEVDVSNSVSPEPAARVKLRLQGLTYALPRRLRTLLPFNKPKTWRFQARRLATRT